jgi:hypothetical protein
MIITGTTPPDPKTPIVNPAAHLHKNADALKGYPFDIKLDALPDAIEQALEMEKEGLEFADQPIPAPETVEETK